LLKPRPYTTIAPDNIVIIFYRFDDATEKVMLLVLIDMNDFLLDGTTGTINQ
jgi:hypothetical protein